MVGGAMALRHTGRGLAHEVPGAALWDMSSLGYGELSQSPVRVTTPLCVASA